MKTSRVKCKPAEMVISDYCSAGFTIKRGFALITHKNKQKWPWLGRQVDASLKKVKNKWAQSLHPTNHIGFSKNGARDSMLYIRKQFNVGLNNITREGLIKNKHPRLFMIQRLTRLLRRSYEKAEY